MSLILMNHGGGESRGAQTKPRRGPAPSTHAGAGRDGRRPLAARAEAGGSAPVRGKEVEGADWAGGAVATPLLRRGRVRAGPVSRPSRTAAAAADKGPPQGPPPSWAPSAAPGRAPAAPPAAARPVTAPLRKPVLSPRTGLPPQYPVGNDPSLQRCPTHAWEMMVRSSQSNKVFFKNKSLCSTCFAKDGSL